MLDPSRLSDALAQSWLPGPDGPHPQSAAASADAFAGAVAPWFAAAQSAGFPAVMALGRQGQLSALAVAALSAQAPVAAGQQLANAAMIYMTGQTYGPGTAGPPAAAPAAGAMIGAALANLDLDRESRAQMIATALHLMALTTIVAFPVPPFTAPVT